MSRHVLMFGWEYPPAHLGGLGVACQGIVRGLLHHGAAVTLVLPHGAASEDGATVLSPKVPVPDDGSVVTVSSLLQPYDEFQSYATRLAGLSLADDGIRHLYGQNLGQEVDRFTSIAVEMTKQVRPDIVHSHDWMTLEAGACAARYHDRPFIAHVHATELDRTEFKPNPWILKREIEGLRKADHILAVSGYTRQLLIREYGIRPDKVTVLHNGTSERHIRRQEHRSGRKHPLVLFLGRLTVQKGAGYFLEAARRVSAMEPDARFVVAGEGYLLPELIRRSCELGLGDRVIFAGKVTTAEARQLYRNASCFVMPSVSEPFGLVALEAITYGAPVILSRQSGAAEVVSNALVVDFWDTDKMADCIVTVLRDAPLQRQMRSETPRILSNLTWDRQAKKILSVYDRILRT